MCAGIPGGHKVDEGDGVTAELLGFDDVGGLPAGMRVATDKEASVGTASEDGANFL